MRTRVVVWSTAAVLSALFHLASAAGLMSADVVVTDARIYTAGPQRGMAEALAVKDGLIVFVGNAVDAGAWIGPHTRIERLGGGLVLPGLFDSHIHPLDIVEFDVCNLKSRRKKTLRDLAAFVSACVRRYHPPAGQWVMVYEWNYTDGNEPDAGFTTLRAALDRAAPNNPVQLIGNDWHHGAFNSAALATATDRSGRTIGFSKASIATEFSADAALIGVDADGEPNGAVNEHARRAMPATTPVFPHLDDLLKAPQRMTRRLNAAGITGILDAKMPPEGLPVYDALLAAHQLTVRATLAQYYEPEEFRLPGGTVDYDAILAKATAVRGRYAGNPLVSADTAKIFADGVLEGNPYAVPPTLPDSPVLEPYLQPIFGKDEAGRLTVTGYVDTAASDCAQVRENPSRYAGSDAVAAFAAAHGYHPGQCAISSGQLQHERGVLLEYAKRLHLAGFNLHIHAIGDAAVRAAVDAIEGARGADGVITTRDGVAHLQLGNPEDIARIGRSHLYIAYTYAWANVDPDYDMTVIPFIQRVHGNSHAALHPPAGYYESNAYPVRSSKEAGAILVAGSDAPVDTADPRPFVNMSVAVTRRRPGGPPLNAEQAISIRDVIDAYTINGARFLGRDKEAGSIEDGKSADFIVLSQDILKLADEHHADDIRSTVVRETWFMGRRVYVGNIRGSNAKRGVT